MNSAYQCLHLSYQTPFTIGRETAYVESSTHYLVNLIPNRLNPPRCQHLPTNNKEVCVGRLIVDAYTENRQVRSSESHFYCRDAGTCSNSYNLHPFSYQLLLSFNMGLKYPLTSPVFVY